MWTQDERRALARKVEAERRAAGLTQEQLADLAEVSRRTIVDLENAKHVPQAATLAPVLAALDITHVNLSGADADATTTGILLAALFERVPDRDRPAVARHLVEVLISAVEPPSARDALLDQVDDRIPPVQGTPDNIRTADLGPDVA